MLVNPLPAFGSSRGVVYLHKAISSEHCQTNFIRSSLASVSSDQLSSQSSSLTGASQELSRWAFFCRLNSSFMPNSLALSSTICNLPRRRRTRVSNPSFAVTRDHVLLKSHVTCFSANSTVRFELFYSSLLRI